MTAAGLDTQQPGLSDDQAYDRLGEIRLLETGIPTCHVAVGPHGKPAYMEWLIAPRDYDRVRAFFGNLYPELAPDEVLLEGGFTPDAYRGKGVMPSAVTAHSTRIAAPSIARNRRWKSARGRVTR